MKRLKCRQSGLPDEVEDRVQETLLALHLQRGTYDPALPVSAWAVAIARHKLVDLWRRRGRRDDLHDAIGDVDERLLAAGPGDGGARRELAVLLESLPEAQRQAIVLTKLKGLSVAEAALRASSSGANAPAHGRLRGRLAGRVGRRVRVRAVLPGSVGRVRGRLVLLGHPADRCRRSDRRAPRAALVMRW